MEARISEHSYLGSMGELLYKLSECQPRNWSFINNRSSMSIEEWRDTARSVLVDKLSFTPESCPLDARVLKSQLFDGYVQEWIDFSGSRDYRISGVLLVPTSGTSPFPAVIALHDHGGFFFYGKEKVVQTDEELPCLRAFKEQYYEGRSWASELARRGYVVLVTDAFGWGVRNFASPVLSDPYSYLLSIEDETYLDQVNSRACEISRFLDLHMEFAGLSWAGIINWDDRRSVDYLLSRSEIDPDRIACVGLSGGGFRSTYLIASDIRVACAGIVGWMTCLSDQLIHELPQHLGLFTAACVSKEMDHPDVAALAVPRPLFVQQCKRDTLFPSAAMQRSCDLIESVYDAWGVKTRFQYDFYDVEHSFNKTMQEDMFDWLDDIL